MIYFNVLPFVGQSLVIYKKQLNSIKFVAMEHLFKNAVHGWKSGALHSFPAGRKFGRFHGQDVYTMAERDCLVRLPMYYNIATSDIEKGIEKTCDFIKSK